MLFLIWTVLSLVMLPFGAPHTVPGSQSGRAFGVMFRFFELGAVTIIALYVLNLPTSQVPQRKIMRWMCVLFFATVAGGYLALAAPSFSFTSPVEAVLPHGIISNTYVQSLVHPAAAQVQTVLGYSAPRPAAPWGYTNTWGNLLSILLVWFCVYMWRPASGWRRLALGVTLAVALVPIVYSLNRGMWFGLLISVAYLVWRLAAQGDTRALISALLLLPVAVLAFLLTPLHGVITQRESHGGSNEVRAFADAAAWHGALESPILGWGGPRKTIGSGQSIAIGPTANCLNCGNVGIGSTGEFWQVAFSNGLIGVGPGWSLFLAAFLALRRDRSPTAVQAARLIIILVLFYSYFYNNLPSAAGITLISISLAWRSIAVPQAVVVRPKPQPAPRELSPLVAGGLR